MVILICDAENVEFKISRLRRHLKRIKTELRTARRHKDSQYVSILPHIENIRLLHI